MIDLNHSRNLASRPRAGCFLAVFVLVGLMAASGPAQTFTTLHSFTAAPYSTNSDGATPEAGLILSGNTLYGTAREGGSWGLGTVFAINTDSTGFRNIHSIAGHSGGEYPYAGVILSGNTLYGAAYVGGLGLGTVFAVNTDGTGFTNLHAFTNPYPYTTNSDGTHPHAGLILSGNTLYGTAYGGGSSGGGTVFAVNTDGTGFTNLHSFTAVTLSAPTNSDGAMPMAGLILSGNTLYGTAVAGGSSGLGTVFAVNTDGTGFRTLHSFTALLGPGVTNSDGVSPHAGLILSGNTLYGTAYGGGSSDLGTVFAVNTDGTGFTTLYNFTALLGPGVTNSDGAYPSAGLILTGNTLYGTAEHGGSSGYGTVFSLSLGSVSASQLTIIPSKANVILTWPTNIAGFTLQSTTNLGSSAVWTTNSPAPVIVNDQYVMTNPISGGQQFYRLSQ
jgi:uncharacterized repeat protein (TIGR03803 family)